MLTEGHASEDLIRRASGGDRDAQNELCEKLQHRLRRHVVGRMGPKLRRWVEADDVVQRVLVEVMDRLCTLPAGSAEDAVLRRLFTVANWRLRDLARHHQRDAGESAFGDELLPAIPSAATMGTLTRRDARTALEQFITCLPADYAAVVRLCGMQGHSFEEAAEKLGSTAEAVRKRYERARRRLTERAAARRR